VGIKRAFDFGAGLLALILLSPLLALIASLVRLKLGSPVLFRQQRPGLHGKLFTIYKFRTMTDARDAQGNLLPDAKRLTRFGLFLRSASLDELPGLFNVLKGDMSLVGPRPLLMQYLDRYTPEQMRRHEVKPGITGWAQACPEQGRRVNGRNAITWEQKHVLSMAKGSRWTLGTSLEVKAAIEDDRIADYRHARSTLTTRPGCARMTIKGVHSDNKSVQRGNDGAREAFHVQGSGAAAHPVPDPSNRSVLHSPGHPAHRRDV